MKIKLLLILFTIQLLMGCGGAVTNDPLMQRADVAEPKSIKKVFKVEPGQWGNAIIVTPTENTTADQPSKRVVSKADKRKAPPLEFVMYLLTLKRS